MRVGIVTHYYKSENYGGTLQAWALCKVLEQLGHSAEQISFDRVAALDPILRLKIRFAALLKHLDPRMTGALRKRRKAFRAFKQGSIPHSRVYTEKTVKNCLKDYDAFITGSDQVWHPMVCCDAYLLKFAPSSKIKLSYAASVAHHELTTAQQQRFQDALADFDGISIREEETAALFRGFINREVSWDLDPTLLLSKEEWEAVCEKQEIRGDYLFCYFLGDGARERELAKEFAAKHHLRIVTLPYLQGYYRACDADFGDDRLFDVSPGAFISLIRDAKYIFTDSFHAAVFSLILEKEFFVVQRAGFPAMATRLRSLMSLFGTEERFLDQEEKTVFSHISQIAPIDYHKEFKAFNDMKERSRAYLRDHLSGKKGSV